MNKYRYEWFFRIVASPSFSANFVLLYSTVTFGRIVFMHLKIHSKNWPHIDHIWFVDEVFLSQICFVQEMILSSKLDESILPRCFWKTWKERLCFWWRLSKHGLVCVCIRVSTKGENIPPCEPSLNGYEGLKFCIRDSISLPLLLPAITRYHKLCPL